MLHALNLLFFQFLPLLVVIYTVYVAYKLYQEWAKKSSISSFLMNEVLGKGQVYNVGFATSFVLVAYIPASNTKLINILLATLIATFFWSIHAIVVGFVQKHWVTQFKTAVVAEMTKVEQGIASGLKQDIVNQISKIL
jgi:hypothetical protein